MAAVASLLLHRLKPQDHVRHLWKFRNCFEGSFLVSVLLSNQIVTCHQAAIALANRLLVESLIKKVATSHPNFGSPKLSRFKLTSLYRFNPVRLAHLVGEALWLDQTDSVTGSHTAQHPELLHSKRLSGSKSSRTPLDSPLARPRMPAKPKPHQNIASPHIMLDSLVQGEGHQQELGKAPSQGVDGEYGLRRRADRNTVTHRPLSSAPSADSRARSQPSNQLDKMCCGLAAVLTAVLLLRCQWLPLLLAGLLFWKRGLGERTNPSFVSAHSTPNSPGYMIQEAAGPSTSLAQDRVENEHRLHRVGREHDDYHSDDHSDDHDHLHHDDDGAAQQTAGCQSAHATGTKGDGDPDCGAIPAWLVGVPPVPRWPQRPLLLRLHPDCGQRITGRPFFSEQAVREHGIDPVLVQDDMILCSCGPAGVFDFESPLVTGRAYVRAKGIVKTPGADAYFEGRKRRMGTVLVVRFKRRIAFDDLITGFEFDSPLQHLPSRWLINFLRELLLVVYPSVTWDYGSDKPYGYVCCCANTQTLVVGSNEASDQVDVCEEPVEDTRALGGAFAQTKSAAERKKLMQNEHERSKHYYETDRDYTFDFYSHAVNPQTYSAELTSFVSLPIAHHLPSPLPIMAKSAATGEYAWRFLFLHEKCCQTMAGIPT